MLSILNSFGYFSLVLFSFFLFPLWSVWEIPFSAGLHQIKPAGFYQEQLVFSVRRLQRRGCFPPSGVRTFSTLFIFWL